MHSVTFSVLARSVVRAFFESGVVLSLMSVPRHQLSTCTHLCESSRFVLFTCCLVLSTAKTLVTDFDCTDEVRCLAEPELHENGCPSLLDLLTSRP